jgi:DNA polymerase III subunit delta'
MSSETSPDRAGKGGRSAPAPGIPPLAGHREARRALLAALARGALPHALLFSGESGIGKRRLAEWLVAARWCQAPVAGEGPCGDCPSCRKVASGQHPDLEVVERNPPKERDPDELGSRTGITVDQIRRGLLPALALRAVEGRGRAAIIDDAESLNEAAQNALLKTLEEPPDGCLVVLVCAHEEALLDTVRSRCQSVRLGPLDAGEMEALFPDADPGVLRLAAGRPGSVVALSGLDVGGLGTLLEQTLQGKVGGAAFARRVQDLVAGRADAAEAARAGAVPSGAAAGTEERDADADHRLVAELLLRHWRDLMARETAPAAGPHDASRSELAADPRLVQEALLELAADLVRHIPPAVAWAAAGQALARARGSARVGP